MLLFTSKRFCTGWRSRVPVPNCLPGLDHRCSFLHKTPVGSAGSWKPGSRWESAITLGSSSGKGHLHSGANAVTGNLQPGGTETRGLETPIQPLCQAFLPRINSLGQTPRGTRLVPIPTYFSQLFFCMNKKRFKNNTSPEMSFFSPGYCLQICLSYPCSAPKMSFLGDSYLFQVL